MKRFWIIALLLTFAALGLRLYVSLHVTSDCSGDGPVYQQIGMNVLQHGAYSMDDKAPYAPTFIRMPGYPLVLAAVFGLFGRGNLTALHVVQSVVDTGTCWLVGLLCFLCAPGGWEAAKRRRAVLWAFLLAALCPFTFVYTGTMLTETWALFFGTLCVTAGVWALKAEGRGLLRWAAAGVAGGVACLFRPDLGLFLAALGALLLWAWVVEARVEMKKVGGWRAALPATGRTFIRGLAFSLAFAAALTPWTMRNAVRFHLFQPLAPAAANMPGEFVAYGYGAWVRTWIARPKDVEVFLWDVESLPVDVAKLPADACDSPQERQRVEALFERYNKGDLTGTASPQGVPELVITPAMDAEFGAIARERVRNHPLGQYLLLPARRAWNMWFDTHSIYYPFDGDLLPLSNLDPSVGQPVLLPLFYTLSWFYTGLGLAGAWVWWRSPECRRWAVLMALLFIPRLAFLSSIPNPEPRYMVELFPVFAAAGGAAIASARGLRLRRVAPAPVLGGGS